MGWHKRQREGGPSEMVGWGGERTHDVRRKPTSEEGRPAAFEATQKPHMAKLCGSRWTPGRAGQGQGQRVPQSGV